MCGIAGMVGVASPEDQQTFVSRALDLIKHRGPDDVGLKQADDATLGMCRLAVIDLECGNQPVASEDGSVIAIVNGEIYNYRELTKWLQGRGHSFSSSSDSEVVVHLYEEFEAEFLSRLDGMFALALYDSKSRQLILARDRFGKKPLYYSIDSRGGFAFCSELKGAKELVASYRAAPTIRAQSVYDYLSFMVVPQPDTIYSEIKAVPPGSFMRIRDGAYDTARYWEPTFEPKSNIGYKDAQLETRRLVSEAVHKRLVADVPVGVLLSGGIDSTVVAYEAARQYGGNLESFTVKFGEKDKDESELALLSAERFGLKPNLIELNLDPSVLVPEMVSRYDQPFADSSAIPSLAVSEAASKNVKVVLNGDGGDELFGGYWRYLYTQIAAVHDRLPPTIRAAFVQALKRSERVRSIRGDHLARVGRGLPLDAPERYLEWTTDLFTDQVKRTYWKAERCLPSSSVVAKLRAGYKSPLDAQVSAELQIALLSDLLVKVDMASMAHSLEARSPLLDYKIADFSLRLPPRHRVRGTKKKAVLRDAYAGVIPREVLNAPKKGFSVPLKQWVDGPLRPLVNDHLLGEDTKVHDFLDRRLVDSVVRGAGTQYGNSQFQTYALLVLELWLRQQSA